MVNHNYICRTTWVDDTQDKEYWYKKMKNSFFINDMYIEIFPNYKLTKCLMECNTEKNEIVNMTKECTANLISAAEKYKTLFYEFENNSFPEDYFITSVHQINIMISKWFLKQSNLPIAPTELHDWVEINYTISSIIYDLSLFYNKENINNWTSENRRWLVRNTIKKYERELELLKESEKNLNY